MLIDACNPMLCPIHIYKGATEEALVDALLGTPELMLDFLVAGGVSMGLFFSRAPKMNRK